MTDHTDPQLDERIRRANQLTPEASQRVLELWPSIETALSEERPVVIRRRSRTPRRRIVLIAIALVLILGAAAAIGGPLRHIFWDSENEPARGHVQDPALSASQLLAGRFARTSTSTKDRATITAIIERNDPKDVPELAPDTPVRVVEARDIGRRLVFIESTNGGFCSQLQGGQVGVGGCVGDFASNGVIWQYGTIGGIVVAEGVVASDVTRLQMELRDGTAEDVPIDHGMFAWNEGRRPAARQAVGLVATRAGTRIHAPMPLDAGDRR